MTRLASTGSCGNSTAERHSLAPAAGWTAASNCITKRRAYACQHCGHHIYPCVGTPFEKSRTNLTKWFFGDVPDDQHPPRRRGEGVGAADRMHLQNGLAHGARAKILLPPTSKFGAEISDAAFQLRLLQLEGHDCGFSLLQLVLDLLRLPRG